MTQDVRCPICGSETFVRIAKKGQNAGCMFHVCSRYPDCKGKVPIEKQMDAEEPVEKDEDAIQRHIEALKSEDAGVRCSAAGALGQIGPDAKAAVPALIEALKDKDRHVREKAAGALGQIGKAAVPALIEALKDKDEVVRAIAAPALTQIGKAAVPALIEALKDKDEDVRVKAAAALTRIGKAAHLKMDLTIQKGQTNREGGVHET